MRLRLRKMTAFLGFASKDFGELGSLFERSEFEQVPKVCEQNRQECSFCDLSSMRKPHQFNVDKRRPQAKQPRITFPDYNKKLPTMGEGPHVSMRPHITNA
jgi:hypothetical protein